MTTPSKPLAWLDAYSRRMGIGLVLALALFSSGCAPKLGGSENASLTTTTGNGQPGDPGTDFTLAVAQSQVTVPAGGRGSNGVSVAWINCAPTSIQLDPDGLPQGLTVAFDTNPTPDLSSLTVAATAAVPAGTYPIRLLGKVGHLQHETKFDLVVPTAPGFALALSPASLDVPAGGSGKLDVAIQRLGGFTDPVALSLSGAPSGVTGTFTAVPVPAASGGGLVEEDHSLLLAVDASVQPGLHTLTVHGASGGVDHAVSFFLRISPVSDFSFSLSPAGITANQTDAASTATQVNLTRATGFTGAVTFTATGAPAGVTPRFTPNPVTGGSANLDFLMNLPQPGAYPIHVTGQSGTVSHTADLILTVNPGGPDFQVTAPATATVDLTGLASGSKTTTIPVSVTALAGFARPVALSASGLPAGATATFSPTSVTPTGSSTLTLTLPASTPAGTSTLTLTGDGGSGLSHSTTVQLTVVNSGTFSLSLASGAGSTVPGGTSADNLTLTPLNGFASDVTLSLAGAPAGITAAFSPNPVTSASGYASTVTFSVAGTVPAGTYGLTVQGGGAGLTRTVAYTLTVRDFTLGASPNPMIVVRGARTPATATLTQTAFSGFADTVNLNVATILPAGLSVSLSPSSITGSGTATVSALATAALPTGDYPVTLQGVDAATGLTRTTILTLRVQDFALTTSSPLIFHGAQGSGSTGTGTLTLSSLNGYAGTVSLAATAPAGLTFTPSPASLSGSGTSTLQAQVVARLLTAGVYSGSVSATDTATGIVHSAPFEVVVEDYTLASGSATTSGTFSWAGSGAMALDLDPATTGFPFDESITWTVTGTADSTGTPVTYWSYTITPNPTSTADTGITLGFTLAPPATGVPSGTYYVTVQGVSATSGVTRLSTFTITVL